MGAATVLAFLRSIEVWLYWAGGLLSLVLLWRTFSGYDRLQRTPFGLEKNDARRAFATSLAALLLVLALMGSLALTNHTILPNLNNLAEGRATPTPTPALTPTPILTPGPIAVDASGCANPQATLQKPVAGERIAGAFAVEGVADIPNFAFYTVEISNVTTRGAWVTLFVGNQPQPGGLLGRFDSTAYVPGEYAMRLVVRDGAGSFPSPCTLVVTLAGVPTPIPEP